MLRGRWQTIACPLGLIELQKWLLRNNTFLVKTSRSDFSFSPRQYIYNSSGYYMAT